MSKTRICSNHNHPLAKASDGCILTYSLFIRYEMSRWRPNHRGIDRASGRLWRKNGGPPVKAASGQRLCLTGVRNLLGSARPMPCFLASHPQETRTRKSPFQCSCASPTKRRVPMDKRDRIPANNMRCPCSRSGAPKQSSKQNAHRVTHNSTLARPGAVSRAVLESYLQACCQIFV